MADETQSRQVAFVTGAAQGIGRAIAVSFAGAGYDVAIADLNIELAQETAAEVAQAGTEALVLECDVSRAEAVSAAVQATMKRFGRLDAAVNNAGGGPGAPSVTEMTEDHWDAVMSSNLRGVWLSMRYQIPAMLRGGGGAIVNIASVFGLVGFEGTSTAYVAAKHGVVGITKAAALQFATQGIRANAVCPGPIDTPGVKEILAGNEDLRREMEAWAPMHRLGAPEEIAGAALWLCTPAAKYVTGVAIPVDGGFTAR